MVVLMSISPAKAPQIKLGLDKFVHFIFYFPLGYWGLRGAKDRLFAFMIIIFGAELGFYLELFQRSVPNRGFELSDIIANISGLIFGAVSGVILKVQLQKR